MESSDPFFSKNDAEAPLNVNGEHYRAVFTDWLFTETEMQDMNNIW